MEGSGMNCDEVLNLLDPLVDHELPDKEQDAVRLHLGQCPACQRELHQLDELRKKMKQVPRYAVPEQLTNGLTERISVAANRSAPAVSWNRWMKPVTTHIAAALVGGVFLYGVIQPWPDTTSPAREITAAHVRSLMDKRLTQVRTGNPHKVAPWFAGKIDYAPAVSDLSTKGFPLLGGRVDYLQERKVAALVYLRREHKINLFVVPVTDKQTPKAARWNRNGYNIVGWRQNDFMYWAVSDLNQEELIAFSGLISAQ